MAEKIKIAQLSDIHISSKGESFRDLPVRNNFLKTMNEVINWNPDQIVFSGDLAAEDGEPGSYFWLKDYLDQLDIPYILMAGNHDNVVTLCKILNLESDVKNGELYFKKEYQRGNIYYLDSSSKIISENQMTWLKDESKGRDGKNDLLFLHHPPILMDCLFMDTLYPLENHLVFWNVLQELNNIQNIFCGHYHHDKVMNKDGKAVYLTPSTMMQIDPVSKEFNILKLNPGWRKIEWDGYSIQSDVDYIN